MPIDPEIAGFLDQLSGLPALDTLSLEAGRALVRDMVIGLPAGPKIYSVENRSITTAGGSRRIRIYRPIERCKAIILYLHGGGWVFGDIDSVDAPLRDFALRTECCIVSMEYRLAPEHPFPAAVEDATAALRWVCCASAELGRPAAPIVVAGDSAGANLAAVTTLMARENGGPSVAGQLLFYPVIDACFDTPSYVENGTGFGLTRGLMQWFWDHYLADKSRRRDFRASPIHAENLGGLPPTLIQTAEFDPLRDEGVAYARSLSKADIRVTLQERAGLIHGYFGMGPSVGAARAAIADAATWLSETILDQ